MFILSLLKFNKRLFLHRRRRKTLLPQTHLQDELFRERRMKLHVRQYIDFVSFKYSVVQIIYSVRSFLIDAESLGEKETNFNLNFKYAANISERLLVFPLAQAKPKKKNRIIETLPFLIK